MDELDRRGVEWLSGLDWPVVTPVMKGLTYAGTHGLVFLAIGVVAAIRLRRPLVAVAVVAANEVASLSDSALKAVIGRERPPLADPNVHPLIPLPHDPSMPSGHAMMAFSGAVILAAVLPRWRWAMLAVAAGVAVSRVYLGVHYPSDVAAGALLGAAVGALAVWLLRRGERALSARRR